jgi:flagellar hook-associated protein 2
MVAETDYLTSGQIYFTGLGSGTDFDTMITKLVELEGYRKTRLENTKSDYEKKIEAVQDINSSLLSLKSSLESMDTMDEFLIKTATSSNESIATVTASSDAEEGSHTIVINQLAKNDIEMHNSGYGSTSDVINSSGSTKIFKYTYNSTTVSIDVADGTTLEGLVNLINQDADNPGVKASLINDGSKYYLQIRGLDLGDKYEITISSDTTLSGFGPDDFSETQDAQNSQIRVDGWPASDWIERESNTISDVITGVTLNLKDVGTIQVDVAKDMDAIKEQVRNFVDQVNNIITTIQGYTKVNSGTNEGSIFTGNSTINMTMENIKSILSSIGVGFDRDNDTYPTLSTIGITTDAQTGSTTYGQLLLDESKLEEALNSNAEAVAEIFSADLVAATNSSDFREYSHINGLTEGGTYDVEYEINASGEIASAKIDGYDASIDNSKHVITSTKGNSKGLAIQIDNLGTGTYSGQIRLKKGKALELIDKLEELTDSYSGPLHIMEDHLNDEIDMIDEQIDNETVRLDTYERNMRDKFARLEALLGYYNNLNTYLTSQINSLPSTSSK